MGSLNSLQSIPWECSGFAKLFIFPWCLPSVDSNGSEPCLTSGMCCQLEAFARSFLCCLFWVSFIKMVGQCRGSLGRCFSAGVDLRPCTLWQASRSLVPWLSVLLSTGSSWGPAGGLRLWLSLAMVPPVIWFCCDISYSCCRWPVEASGGQWSLLVTGASGHHHHLLTFLTLITFERYAKKDSRGLHILQKSQTSPIRKVPFHP